MRDVYRNNDICSHILCYGNRNPINYSPIYKYPTIYFLGHENSRDCNTCPYSICNWTTSEYDLFTFQQISRNNTNWYIKLLYVFTMCKDSNELLHSFSCNKAHLWHGKIQVIFSFKGKCKFI